MSTLIPISSPRILNSGPPLFPGFTAASVWMKATALVPGRARRVALITESLNSNAIDIARAMALGADWCNSARGFMFALGCIQAQACHTGHCPTGVTTQDPVRQQALANAQKRGYPQARLYRE